MVSGAQVGNVSTWYDYTVSKRLKVSIVIPVYNEASSMERCLRAIAAQTVRPHEVIVVDNNSKDSTVEIAKSFDFVTVLHEPKQGVVHARNTGFDAANGDILGRIDADTVIAPDWVATLLRIFISTDADAVSGSMRYHDVLFPDTWAAVDAAVRRYMAWSLGPEVAIQGANMGIRRTAWTAIRKQLCMKGGLHEDFDIALHLYKQNFHVRYYKTLEASIQYRQAGGSWREFSRYVLLSPRTYAAHQRISRLYMYPVVWFLIGAYPLLYFTYRGFDERTGKFSIRKLIGMKTLRVNPATFVD
jgi:glycosyltransferase involved in cell wall biosynthesis